MDNANKPGTRRMWTRPLKKQAAEKTVAARDPYMLTEDINRHDDEAFRLEAASKASKTALAAKTTHHEEVLGREATRKAAKASHHDEKVRQEAARKALKTKLPAKTSRDQEARRLEAARKAAKVGLAAETEEFAIVAKTKGAEGLQDVDEQRVRSVDGQIPTKKGPINNCNEAVAVSVLAPSVTSEMIATHVWPAVRSCVQSLSGAPLPIQHGALVTSQGSGTKRKAPDVAACGGAAPMTHEGVVQVKEPELPLYYPAPNRVAGNLSRSISNNSLRDHQNVTVSPSVSESEQGPKCRRVIKQGAGSDDWLNCDPPQCADCGQSRWPTWTSKRGIVHCGFCFQPDGGRPSCSRCDKLTWDGLTGPGKRWFCEACFINDRAVQMHPSWTGWFRERRNRFPEAFVNGGPT